MTVEMNEFQYGRFFTMYNFSDGCVSKNTFYKLGDVVECGRNGYIQEKQCAGHIVRKVGRGIDDIHVIRDDGTVWNISLRGFKSYEPIEVLMRR